MNWAALPPSQALSSDAKKAAPGACDEDSEGGDGGAEDGTEDGVKEDGDA